VHRRLDAFGQHLAAKREAVTISEGGANALIIRRRLYATREESFNAWTDMSGEAATP
jgi:hypothetical protein